MTFFLGSSVGEDPSTSDSQLLIVKILAYNEGTVLVEAPHGRRLIPAYSIPKGIPGDLVACKTAVFDMGIVQDWWLEELPEPVSITREALAQSLRDRGLWTPNDALAHPQAVLSALMQVCGVELGRILDHARRYRGQAPRTPQGGER